MLEYCKARPTDICYDSRNEPSEMKHSDSSLHIQFQTLGLQSLSVNQGFLIIQKNHLLAPFEGRYM